MNTFNISVFRFAWFLYYARKTIRIDHRCFLRQSSTIGLSRRLYCLFHTAEDRLTGRMPDAAPNEAENVEQPKAIVTHQRAEVNPKASAAWMRRLSGHALLCDPLARPY